MSPRLAMKWCCLFPVVALLAGCGHIRAPSARTVHETEKILSGEPRKEDHRPTADRTIRETLTPTERK